MSERHRGRRSAATPQNQSLAEREIRAAQAELIEARALIEERTVALAQLISDHMADGVATAEIGTWLTSPEKPKGVTRQQVYKLVAERVDGRKMRTPKKPEAKRNGTARPTKPRPKPRPVR